MTTEEDRTSWVSAINKAAIKPVTVREEIEEVTYSTADGLGTTHTHSGACMRSHMNRHTYAHTHYSFRALPDPATEH